MAVGDQLLPFPAHSEQSCCQHRSRYESAPGETAATKQARPPGLGNAICVGPAGDKGGVHLDRPCLPPQAAGSAAVFLLERRAGPCHPSAAKGTVIELTTDSWSDLCREPWECRNDLCSDLFLTSFSDLSRHFSGCTNSSLHFFPS